MTRARSGGEESPRARVPTPIEREQAGSNAQSPPLLPQSSEERILAGAISPLRKAAIVLVSLEHSLASLLLSHIDRSAVEAVTWEIARLESIEPAERLMVLEEFYDLGLCRLCFVFDDLIGMKDDDIRTAFQVEEIKIWALALACAAASVRSKVLGALPASAANRLRHHLEHLGPFRLSDSEAAQLDITERLRQLHDHGRITFTERSGREEVLV
jgi:flagellar motor switch protein FliG